MPRDKEVAEQFKNLTFSLTDVVRILEAPDPLFIANKMITFVNFSYLSGVRGILVTGSLLGIEAAWSQMAQRLHRNEDDLRTIVNETINRRNDIVHRADREKKSLDGPPQEIGYAWAKQAVAYVSTEAKIPGNHAPMTLDSGAVTCSTRPPAEHRETQRGEDRAEGEAMTGDEVRQVCEARLPQEAMDRLCATCGVIERERQLNLGMFVRARVISAGTPGGDDQADVLRAYLECEGPRVARSAFDRGCDEPLARCMAALAERALAYARAQPVARAGPLCGVQDWDSVDATTVTVREALREACPGTGDDAALKGHTGRSVGCGAPGRDHCRPAREPDRRQLPIDASWRGSGLLADLASASLERLRACDAHGVRCVIRRQENWKPKGDSLARGQVTQAVCPGTDLDARLDQESLRLDGRVIDADVHVGRGAHALSRRLVGVQTPQGYGFFLTNRLPRIGPRPVADLSRVRWEVERRIRLDTSVHRLEASDAERPCSVKTLLHASRMASPLAALLAHTHHVHTRPPQAGAPRTAAPLHPRRLALPRAVSCQSMAQAFELQGAEAAPRGNTSAAWLTHSGRDPTWRRRPSVLDQLRGWKRQPMARKATNSGDVSHGHVKAAA